MSLLTVRHAAEARRGRADARCRRAHALYVRDVTVELAALASHQVSPTGPLPAHRGPVPAAGLVWPSSVGARIGAHRRSVRLPAQAERVWASPAVWSKSLGSIRRRLRPRRCRPGSGFGLASSPGRRRVLAEASFSRWSSTDRRCRSCDGRRAVRVHDAEPGEERCRQRTRSTPRRRADSERDAVAPVRSGASSRHLTGQRVEHAQERHVALAIEARRGAIGDARGHLLVPANEPTDDADLARLLAVDARAAQPCSAALMPATRRRPSWIASGVCAGACIAANTAQRPASSPRST